MFKDEIKEILLPQIKIPKLKGHTKIELTDVHTGKKEVIEHDNAFTTGLNDYFFDGGIALKNPLLNDYVRQNKLWENLLGGIYLFDTALAATEKYMPAGVTMIGNSYVGASNSGVPTELGSYNAIESFGNHNTINLVYDFSTAQANGNIASVCLGTKTGGKIGYGNTSGGYTGLTSLAENVALSTFMTGQPSSDNNYARGARLIYDNKIYIIPKCTIGGTQTELKIRYGSAPISKIDIFEQISNVDTTTWQEMTININPLGSDYIAVAAGDSFPTCFLLLPQNSLNAGDTFYTYLVDVTTGSFTQKFFPNLTGKSIYANTGIYLMFLDDTYALVQAQNASGDIYKIKHTTGEVIGQATKNGYTNSGYGRYNMGAYAITKDLYVFGTSARYIYDKVKNAFFPTNGNINPNPSSSSEFSGKYISEYDVLYGWFGGQNSSNYLINNPLRLMTINNLDTPVEKTAAKTMKVTYTITRASA